MYSQYQCLPCCKYQNDEVDGNLSCKCTVLCYILEYMYILQITMRRIGPVLALKLQIPDQVECCAVFACWKQAQDLCVSLLFVQHLYIFKYVTKNSTFTRQTTLSFIILVLIIMYTLVSGVHVCNNSFCILSLTTRSLQVHWSHANDIKHDVHPRYMLYRCIERER